MCSFSPTDGHDLTPEFRRGYTRACAVLAAILAVELIAAVWLG
ncbi:hypothetical protein [Bradyrhizobium sp.]|nr:hypothetical protein [Bradyrhizobium sp.]